MFPYCSCFCMVFTVYFFAFWLVFVFFWLVIWVSFQGVVSKGGRWRWRKVVWVLRFVNMFLWFEGPALGAVQSKQERTKPKVFLTLASKRYYFADETRKIPVSRTRGLFTFL